MEKLHRGKVSEKAMTKIVEGKLQSSRSLLKYKVRRERENELKN